MWSRDLLVPLCPCVVRGNNSEGPTRSHPGTGEASLSQRAMEALGQGWRFKAQSKAACKLVLVPNVPWGGSTRDQVAPPLPQVTASFMDLETCTRNADTVKDSEMPTREDR